MKHIAIFASGAGTNAEKIINGPLSGALTGARGPASPKGAEVKPPYKVALIVCNKPGAGVLNIAGAHHIPTLIIEKEKFFRGNGYVDELKASGIDFIVLAGFLWKLPAALTRAYPHKIINIHPALLPKYGGKGMYGHHVHEAVIAAKEKESGITIHYVDEVYDHGPVILQAKCSISENETPETLAKKVQALEHRHFPAAVALLATL